MTEKPNVTLYVCDHCKRKMQVKKAMINHEEHCSKNPKNIAACQMCIHLQGIKIDYSVYCGTPYGELVDERKANGFKCNKLNKMLYPHKAVAKGLVEKWPETFEGQEEMPTTCEHYQFKI